jgi:hypothetical protein
MRSKVVLDEVGDDEVAVGERAEERSFGCRAEVVPADHVADFSDDGRRNEKRAGRVSSSREHSSCQTSVSSKPAMSGPASTRSSLSSTAHPVSDVVLQPLAQGVLAGADAAQPAQLSAPRRGVPVSFNDLEPDAVTGVQRNAESFGDLSKFGCDDELVGTVCCGHAHGRPPPGAIIAPGPSSEVPLLGAAPSCRSL